MNELRALAGAVIFSGFDGATVASAGLEALEDVRPSGVLFFSRNVASTEDVRALTSAIRVRLGDEDAQPVLALDQEGGRVARVHEDVPELPSAMAFGAAGDVALTERAARDLGVALAGLGFSLDLAPCADLALDPGNTAIGTRAYAADPDVCARHVAAFVRGLAAAGMDGCVKHAPGHGATAVDSHLALPVLDVPPQTLAARELVPFRAAVDAGVAALMVGHLIVPALDPARPATTSPAVVRFLRESIGVSRPLLTDCLTMGAVASGGIAQSAVAALCAGIDGVLVSTGGDDARATRDAIEDAVRSGRLAYERLESAAARLRVLRRPRTGHAAQAWSTDASSEAAARAITAVRGSLRFDPALPASVISFEGTSAGGAVDAERRAPSLSAALRHRRFKSEHLRVGLDPEASEIDVLLGVLAAQGARNVAVVVRRARVHPRQRDAVNAILTRIPDALVVAASEPFDLAVFPHASRMVATYGDGQAAFSALAEILAGRADARGHLPVPLALAGEHSLA